MNVNLGTLEVNDHERRFIKLSIKDTYMASFEEALKGKETYKLATREDVRQWAFDVIIAALSDYSKMPPGFR